MNGKHTYKQGRSAYQLGGFSALLVFFKEKCFRSKTKNHIFASENPNGEENLPLIQKRILMTSLKSIRIVMNQTLNDIRFFIVYLGFHFSYSLSGFRNPLCNLSLITLQSYGKYFKKASILRSISLCHKLNIVNEKL